MIEGIRLQDIRRFMKRVRQDHRHLFGGTPCWTWTGAKQSKGYGVFRLDARWHGGKRTTPELAHRVAYRLFVGPIPPGKDLHHKCYNPACCNPGHLEAISKADNTAWANQRRAGNGDGNGDTVAATAEEGESPF